MMQKVILQVNLYLLFVSLLSAGSCTENGVKEPEGSPPILMLSSPANGETDVLEGTTEISLWFDVNITFGTSRQITLNGQSVTNLRPALNGELKITVPPLQINTEYILLVPSQTVKGPTGVFNKSEYSINFKTRAPAPPREGLSPQAEKLLLFMKQQEGNATLSGTMANVSWNINEAEWVHHHTGKWPALNCFDFIHLHASPSSWIDYSDISTVEEWWDKGGVVSAMWHWNVPDNSSDENSYSFYWGNQLDQTNFDVKKIEDPSSEEYKRMIYDIDKVSEYLLLLKDKNIPVIWRPLHEAAGNMGAFAGGTAWFWWGAGGAEPLKKLWRLMYDRMTHQHGLNNLIWVWTSQITDHDWYPGDDYVDMVGRDIYNASEAKNIDNDFATLQQRYPGKPAALSECGNVAEISKQWDAGAKWIWFMPWYDYNRTLNSNSDAFKDVSHEHAPIRWWNDAFNLPFVLTRDELPDLK